MPIQPHHVAVSTEQFIGPQAGEGHPHPACAGGSGDQVAVEPIDAGLVDGLKKTIEGRFELGLADAKGLVLEAQMLGGERGQIGFIDSPRQPFEAHRNTADRAALAPAQIGGQQAGIETAAEEQTHRNITDRLAFHGPLQGESDLGRRVVPSREVTRMGCRIQGGEWVGKGVQGPGAPRAPLAPMAGGKHLHPREQGEGRGHGAP